MPSEHSSPGHRRLIRWLFRGTCLLALCGLLVWFAPALVANSPLWPRVLANLTSDFDGEIEARSVTLGWFSPVLASDIEIRDADGNPLAEIATVRTDATLISLLNNRSQLGVIHVEQPRLLLQVREDSSNLEDALASLLSRRSPSAVDGTIKITGGSVAMHDEVTDNDAELQAVCATVQLPSSSGGTGKVTFEKCKVAAGTQIGSCSATARWQAAGQSPSWSVEAQVESVALVAIAPFARRVSKDMDLGGVLTGNADCAWDGERQQMTIKLRRARAQPLRLTAPAWLGDDQLALGHVVVNANCTLTDGVWDVSESNLDCDAGHFTIDGRFGGRSGSDGSTWTRFLAGAAAANVELSGEADLARLAQVLPNTLHIREGTEIESGMLQFQFAGRQESDDRRRWTARIETSDVAARRNGRKIQWVDPLKLALKAEQTADGWSVDRFDCHSTSSHLTGQGTSGGGSFTLNCDLDQFVGELQQFVDLGPLRAAGSLTAGLHWRRSETGHLSLNGDGLIKNLELAQSPEREWREPRLAVSLAMEGETVAKRLAAVQTARVELLSATDRLELELLEPVKGLDPAAPWALGCKLRGKWSSWLTRLRPLVPATALDMEGSVQLGATLRLSAQTLDVENVTVRSEPFHLSSPGLVINEQIIETNLSGRWDMVANEWSINEGTFQTPAVAIRLRNMRVTEGILRREPDQRQDGLGRTAFQPEKSNRQKNIAASDGSVHPRLSGELSFRADLDRFLDSWRIPENNPQWRLSGAAEGQLSLVQNEGNTNARWSLDLNNAKLARRSGATGNGLPNVIPASSPTPWNTVWQEPVVKLVGTGRYDRSKDIVHLDRFDLSSPGQLHVTAQGTLAQPLAQCAVDCQGQVSYDLDKLTERLRLCCGTNVQASGQDTKSFWLRGPLRPIDPAQRAETQTGAPRQATNTKDVISRNLAGQCALNWKSASLFGIAVGDGLIQAKLHEGVISTDAIELPLSGGTLHVAPQLHLNAEPVVLSLDPQRVLSDVRITPEMCQDWLKYIAPLAAHTTRAEGQFSMSIQKAIVPVERPSDANIDGVMAVQNAKMGPSPLAQQLIGVAEQVRSLLLKRLPSAQSVGQTTWLTLPEQNVRFQIADQRVYHDRIEFTAGDLIVRTRGSVGLDQTLSLVAQIPIRDQWVQKDRLLSLFKGQTIEIPISGTLGDPRLDRRALERLSGQVIQKAAGRLLENELQRGLEQLFGPIR